MRDRLKRPKKKRSRQERACTSPSSTRLLRRGSSAPPPRTDVAETSISEPHLAEPEAVQPEFEAFAPAHAQSRIGGSASQRNRSVGWTRRPTPQTAAGKRWTRPRWSAGCKVQARRRQLPVRPRAARRLRRAPRRDRCTAPRDATAAPKASKGTVVLAIGLPGSGKSSWFKRHNITPLSSDMLRALLFDDPTEQRFQDLIFSNLRSMLKARLIARRPLNYVDATNLTPHERQSWIKLGHDYGYEVQAVFFDVPAGGLPGAQSQAGARRRRRRDAAHERQTEGANFRRRLFQDYGRQGEAEGVMIFSRPDRDRLQCRPDVDRKGARP